jgi:hypothetical protein
MCSHLYDGIRLHFLDTTERHRSTVRPRHGAHLRHTLGTHYAHLTCPPAMQSPSPSPIPWAFLIPMLAAWATDAAADAIPLSTHLKRAISLAHIHRSQRVHVASRAHTRFCDQHKERPTASPDLRASLLAKESLAGRLEAERVYSKSQSSCRVAPSMFRKNGHPCENNKLNGISTVTNTHCTHGLQTFRQKHTGTNFLDASCAESPGAANSCHLGLK